MIPRKLTFACSITALLLYSTTLTGNPLLEAFSQAARSAAGQTSSETIMVLLPDGKNYISFSGYRSSNPVNIIVERGVTPQSYLYFFPTGVRTERENATQDAIRVPSGGYSTMDEETFTIGRFPGIKDNGDGTFTYRNWDGTTRNENGKYGMWLHPGNYDHFSIVWIFPENIEPVKWEANRRGRWQRNGSILTFYGENINSFVYSVTYRVRTSEVLEAKTLP